MEIKSLVVGPFLTNCYLLISRLQSTLQAPDLLIIDPGGEAEKILAEIEKIKAKPKYIINTHYHWDHTFGNKIIKKSTGAEILIHQAEKDFIKFEPDRFLEDGEEIKVGERVLKVIHTPGHSKGSICLLGEDFIFSGDTLFKDGQGRTDLPGGSEKDLKQSLEKLKKILKPGMKVYPGHGEIFKIK